MSAGVATGVSSGTSGTVGGAAGAVSGDLPGGGPETAVNQTRLLYAGANRMTAMRLAVLDLPEGNAMRAPGEAPGLMALEIAIDEMAEKLGIDPVEFRILNDTQVDPEKLCVIRATEQILFPEENADLGAGYAVVDVTPNETWIVTSEIPTKGSRNYNRVLLAKLLWSQPNRLFAK